MSRRMLTFAVLLSHAPGEGYTATDMTWSGEAAGGDAIMRQLHERAIAAHDGQPAFRTWRECKVAIRRMVYRDIEKFFSSWESPPEPLITAHVHPVEDTSD